MSMRLSPALLEHIEQGCRNIGPTKHEAKQMITEIRLLWQERDALEQQQRQHQAVQHTDLEEIIQSAGFAAEGM